MSKKKKLKEAEDEVELVLLPMLEDEDHKERKAAKIVKKEKHD